MNKGTKIRTVALVIVLLNQANVNLGGWEFGNPTVDTVYKIISYLLTILASVAALYYNNDFTEEACRGTALTRQLKLEKKEGYIGDTFFEGATGEGVADEQDDI